MFWIVVNTCVSLIVRTYMRATAPVRLAHYFIHARAQAYFYGTQQSTSPHKIEQ